MAVTMISRGVEISIAGGVAETEDATFTGKVIMEYRGQLGYTLWALGCSTVYLHLRREVRHLSIGGPNLLLDLGGLGNTPIWAQHWDGASWADGSVVTHLPVKEVIGAAAVTLYRSLPSIQLNVLRRIYKGCMGNHQIWRYT